MGDFQRVQHSGDAAPPADPSGDQSPPADPTALPDGDPPVIDAPAGSQDGSQLPTEDPQTPEEKAAAWDRHVAGQNADEGGDGNDPPAAGENDYSAALAEVPENLRPFVDKFTKGEEITQEDYATLEAEGFSKSMADSWMAGQNALAAQRVSFIHEQAGGETNYQKMAEWTITGLTKEERASYNTAIKVQDQKAVKTAVSGMWARYLQANPTPGRRNKGGHRPPAAPSVTPYASSAEMTKAMGDPRYQTDPAYRDEVARKVNVSTF